MDFIFEEDMDEVGSDIEAYCPKCKADTAHTVITKYEDEVRRVQCSTCGDVHAYRKPRGEVEDDTPEPIAAKKRAAAKKPTWQEWIDKIGPNKANNLARPYTIREQYHEGDIVSHPKFGVGIVTEISENKAEVTFQDERRVLVHNRPDLAAQMPAIAPTPAPREEKSKGKKGGKGAPAAKGAAAAAAAAAAAKAAAVETPAPKGKDGTDTKDGKAAAVAKEAPTAKGAAHAKDTHAKDAHAKDAHAKDAHAKDAHPAKAPAKDTKVAAKAPPPAPAKGKETKPAAAESKRPVQGKAERAKAAVQKKEVAKGKAPAAKPAAKPAARAAAAKAPAKAVRRPEPAKGKVKARR